MRGVRRDSSEDGLPISLGLPVPLPFPSRDPNLQEKYRVGLNRIAAQEVPIEIKVVNPPTLSQLRSMEPKQMFWVRARGYIGKRTLWTGRNPSQGVGRHLACPVWPRPCYFPAGPAFSSI